VHRYHVSDFLVLLLFFLFLNWVLFICGSIAYRDVRYSTWFRFDVRQYIEQQDTMISDAEQHIRELVPQRYAEVRREKRFLHEAWNDTIDVEKRPFCVGIMSRARAKNYLVAQVWSILRSLSPEEQRMAQFFVFATDFDPSENAAAQAVRDVIPVVTNSDVPPRLVRGLERPRNDSKWFEKQTMDFMTMLRMCERLAHYCVMLEDDAIASPHFIRKLQQRALPALHRYEQRGEKWLLVRLFYTEFWNGWENRDTPLLMALAASLAYLLSTAHLWMVGGGGGGNNSSSNNNNNKIRLPLLRNPYHVTVLLLWFFTCLWVPWAIGKQNLRQTFPSSGLQPFSQKAANVAVMYPASIVPDLVHYLNDNLYTTEVDLLVDQVATEENWLRFQLLPHLFQHVGAFSSNKEKSQGDFLEMKVTRQFDESEEDEEQEEQR
jgi:hypothetical protein